MGTFTNGQQKILDYLLDKTTGVSAMEMADHLDVTKSAVKEHLLKLVDLGLVIYEDVQGQVGRPRRYYKLTPEGHEHLPRQYSWLSNILLEHLTEDRGSIGAKAIMRSLADKVSTSLKVRFQDLAGSQVLKELAKVMNELGYKAILKQSDLRKGAVIEASNCVYHSVALKHPELCEFDIQLIHKTSGLNVKLESCIARGGEICRFCLH